MNILKLDYQGLPVHANREAWFNATQIAAMFGRRPIDWLRLPETERYIRALCKREAEKQGKSEVRKSHFVKTKKGGDLSQPEIQGTWLHPKLAVAFARWCDIDFALWCDEQIEALITDGQVWHAERAKSSIAHQVMTEILRSKRQAEGKATLPHHYGNEALLCNAALNQPHGVQKVEDSNIWRLTAFHGDGHQAVGQVRGMT
ncbi:KilA-N domain-containing protein [Eikenella corrodens]|uniref:KilA-N domain-containing protein n=1 Tax=Eikenella corrodens TaxID=539 RepID=UPI0009BDBB14|nr:KilA-N domain-containing protein [Eikenella corrodens]